MAGGVLGEYLYGGVQINRKAVWRRKIKGEVIVLRGKEWVVRWWWWGYVVVGIHIILEYAPKSA